MGVVWGCECVEPPPQVKAIEGVVADTEKALKMVSDEVLVQRCPG